MKEKESEKHLNDQDKHAKIFKRKKKEKRGRKKKRNK